MKKNYILALFLTFVVIVVTYVVPKNNVTDIAEVKDTVSENDNFNINNIYEQTDKYKITAYIPCTNISSLDEKIKKQVDDIVISFKKDTENLNLLDNDRKFELYISFNAYEYKDYSSFLIIFSYNLGGAHPNRNFVTINYNKKENSFVTIDTLIAKDNDVLNKLSNYCLDYLKNNQNLNLSDDLLKQGSLNEKKNFEKFILSNEGVILFFPSYIFMPYYMGELEIIIPYDKIIL